MRPLGVVAFSTLATSVLATCEGPTTPTTGREPDASISTEATRTFRVNSTADAVDARPGDGVCRTRAGTCTLRAAIQEANALAGAEAISVPAGVYRITIPQPPNQGITGGDLNVVAPLTITGAGAGRTHVDGSALSGRILVVEPSTAGRVLITNLSIENGGDFNAPHDGGGVLVKQGASALLRGVAVRNNQAPRFGAGIMNAGTLTVELSTVVGNRVPNVAGGGISNDGTLTLDRSIVTGNISANGGGIFNRGTLVVRRSTLNHNTGSAAGAVYNSGSLTVLNTTISGNIGRFYGGGIVNSGRVSLNSATITANEGHDQPGQGSESGGIANVDPGIVTVSNTILAGNTQGRRPLPVIAADCNGVLTSAGYNLIGTTSHCTISGDQTGNLIGVDPKLGPLQNNGGPTPTHALLAGSPARNAANPARPGGGYPACPPLDQRLKSRTRDARCDMGAVEMP
jgi:CSLREA domain-containing protein